MVPMGQLDAAAEDHRHGLDVADISHRIRFLGDDDVRFAQWLSGPSFVVGRRHVYVLGQRTLAAVPTRCSIGRGACESSWRVPVPRNAWGLFKGPGETVLVAVRRTVVAYPSECGATCEPSWHWKAKDRISNIKRAEGLVLVSTNEGKVLHALSPETRLA